MNCELFDLRGSQQINQRYAGMKQLTSVVERGQRLGDGVGAGGQQHLGQHGGADLLQMFHRQLADITEPKLGQNLAC